MKAIITLLVAMSFSFNALADQCQVLSTDQMTKGVQALKEKQKELAATGNTMYVAFFCQPCGDKFPSFQPLSEVGNQPWLSFGETLADWSKKDDASKNWEIMVNGKAVDAAYTYFLAQPNNATSGKSTQVFANLAKSTGCEAQRVSDYLNVAFEGQSTAW